MGKSFARISDRESLECLLKNSNERPVVVFKHSNSCPISSAAYREMEKLDGEVNLLEVQTARDVSREFATITGIQHESPQVIVLRDGKAVWNASHCDVKASAVGEALRSYS
jgi:bacillithiol system protein YtxJ